MTWDFKRALYCSEKRVAVRSVGDLGDPAVRRRLQQHFDAKAGSPPEGSDAEYSYYFEAAYPHEMDRRRYIEQQVSAAVPSYGHRALAVLLRHSKLRLIWTTNFDRLIEDAMAAASMTTGRLTVASLDNASVAGQALSEGRYPLLVKLHGDFQSRQLKNVGPELARQDEDLRRTLVSACGMAGLAVTGYSGRDASVMAALEAGIAAKSAYPGGLFWFRRSDSPLSPRVRSLLETARKHGVQAEEVEIETFDELMGDLVRQVHDIPEADVERLDVQAPRVTNAPLLARGRGWPVVRLNGLPLLDFPQTCRRIECSIGNTQEVRKAVSEAGVNVFVARKNVGVLAFGSDSDLKAAFGPYGITTFDLHGLEAGRLRHDGAELGLLKDALAAALARGRPLKLRGGRTQKLAVDAGQVGSPSLQQLRDAVGGSLVGTCTAAKLAWAEALEVRLEHRLDRLWIQIVPTIWFEKPPVDAAGADEIRAAAAGFVRERKVRRYNRIAAALLDAWLFVLFGAEKEAEFRALGIGDGVDAVFRASRTTAYSRRAR